jgi:urease accessory protein
MIDDQLIGVSDLFSYLENLLKESLLVDAVYCRTAHNSTEDIQLLSGRLSALRCARESREASLALGKRFLRLVASLDPSTRLQPGEIHFSIAFGHACGALSFDLDQTVAAFLHQNIAATISAAQRLLPLGQIQSSQIAWDLKPAIEDAVARSATLNIDTVSAFSHLPDLASMRHCFLPTRLFIS